MRTSILTILAYFVMCSVGYASDVYITQSGASLTANINQDGQTNKVGNDTTDFTMSGDNQTYDIDQVGNTNTITGSVTGDDQNLTLLILCSVILGILSVSINNILIQRSKK